MLELPLTFFVVRAKSVTVGDHQFHHLEVVELASLRHAIYVRQVAKFYCLCQLVQWKPLNVITLGLGIFDH